MTLAQSTYWVAELNRSGDGVCLSLLNDVLRAEHEELGELRIDVPLADWQRVVRVVRSDRKLLGGILLDLARHKDHVGAAMASDRLFLDLADLGGRATLVLLERERLIALPPEDDAEE